jgi:plasmid replication initiation protein
MEKLVLNTEYPVQMNNNLLLGKQSMGINEAKLLRLVIMQVVKQDEDFKTYTASIKDLAVTLNIQSGNLYRDVQKICENLLQSLVRVGDGNPKHKWKTFQWMSSAGYENGIVTLKMHEEIKPYLLGMNGYFTTYSCENILAMNSFYGVRLYELITFKLMNGEVVDGREVELTVDEIRKACGCEKKYERMSSFKEKVINIAVKEINEFANIKVVKNYEKKTKNGMEKVYYKDVKHGRNIESFKFYITVKHGDVSKISEEKKAEIETKIKRMAEKNAKKLDAIAIIKGQ